MVVRNGKTRARRVTVGARTIRIQAPRVNDQPVVGGLRQKFTSQILPPYLRRSPKVSAVLPLLYLHGLSSGDFQAALPVLLGEDAAGLSPAAITRLTAAWRTEYDQWRQRSLTDRDFIARFFRNGTLVAAASVGRDLENLEMEAALRSRAPPTPRME